MEFFGKLYKSSKAYSVLSLLFVAVFASAQVTPPEFIIEDRVGVNLASGKPSFKVNDLSIGSGQLSLEHSISSYAGFFYGYHDYFTGGVLQTEVRMLDNDTVRIPVMQVTGLGGSKNFKINSDGSYSDFREEGENLDNIAGGRYLYTKKDGTELTYKFFLEQVKYPNGFVVKIHRSAYRIHSVTTNNGLQMKWFYSRNTVPTKRTTTGSCIPYVMDTCRDDPALNDYYYKLFEKELWEYNFPTHIVALNNAVEHCTTGSESCNITGNWARSGYTWDYDMPNNMYTENTDFTVQDMAGNKTLYRHKLYDRSIDNQGLYFVPRVAEIRNGNNGSILSTYSYANTRVCTGYYFYVSCRTAQEAVLKTATKGDLSWAYSIGENGGWRGTSNSVISGIDRVLVQLDSSWGVPISVGAKGVNYKLEYTNRNRVLSSSDAGHEAFFYYDARGNLNRRLDKAHPSSSEAGQQLVTEANYPSSCTNSNRKVCNKKTWDKDAKGNFTYFEYHPQSGQLIRETKPADRNGLKAQTRRKYKQYYARYKKTSNSIVQADSPIWLLSEESYCINGAARAPATGQISNSQEGCALGTIDEVRTVYEYGTGTSANNLWLKGKAVIADGKTLRTCYEYDQYGNQIGETKPMGVTGTCN